MSSEGTTDARLSKRRISLRIGGLLTVVIGLLALNNGLAAMTGDDSTTSSPYLTPGTVCGTTIIFFGVVAVAGGICALMRRYFSLALAGTLLGMMGGGWLNFILGITAFIFYYFAGEDL